MQVDKGPEAELTERALRARRREQKKEEQKQESMAGENRQPERVLRDYFMPVLNENYSGIQRQTVNANNFELKPALINMVQQNQFGGLPFEDPNIHLSTFLELCDTIKMNGVPDDAIRMKLFPFSLRDKARRWLQSLQPGSIARWEDLATRFLTKFFPPSKTSQLRGEIAQFMQKDQETFYEAWERFKDLLRQCPQHGYQDWFQIQLFYNGVNERTKTIIDAASGGSILSKTPEEVMTLLEEMAANNYQWGTTGSNSRRVAAVDKEDPIATLSAQLSALTSQMAALNAKGQTSREGENEDQEECQFMNNRTFTFKPATNLPNNYHPGLRNHENFSYANTRNVLNPPVGYGQQQIGYSNPPGFQQQQPAMERKPSLEDTLATFISESRGRFAKIEARADKTETRLNNIESHCENMTSTLKSLETQIGQLANALKNNTTGSFPSDTENPREVKAIALRSGKKLTEPTGTKQIQVGKEKVEAEKEKEKVIPGSIKFSDDPPLEAPKLPFPQRFQRKNLDDQFSKFLEIFKKIHINIPFAEALEKMPNYVKFMKDVMSKKRRWKDSETINLTEECSALLQKKLPLKQKDPGCFTVPCTIGNSTFERALCDLGASINLMPYSVYEKMGLGEFTPTRMTLQMADRSLKYPRGVIEDVLVKVDKFIFPVDFVVLDMEEGDIPIILGRPFLATGRALVDVEEGSLTLRVNKEEVKFNIFKILKNPEDTPSCSLIDIMDPIDSYVREVIQEEVQEVQDEEEDFDEHNMIGKSGDQENIPEMDKG